MFGTHTTGDTSGYGRMRVRPPLVPASDPPYGWYFDEITDALADGLQRAGSIL